MYFKYEQRNEIEGPVGMFVVPTQRTIYQYHRVMIDTAAITNHTAVIITPLPSKSSVCSFIHFSAILLHHRKPGLLLFGSVACDQCSLNE